MILLKQSNLVRIIMIPWFVRFESSSTNKLTTAEHFLNQKPIDYDFNLPSENHIHAVTFVALLTY